MTILKFYDIIFSESEGKHLQTRKDICMATISKAIVDSSLRNTVFSSLNIANVEGFQKINDRQYGILLTDENGVERYVRVGAIVAELRKDISARDLMMMEIKEYMTKTAEKAQKASERAAKAEKDKAAREAKRKEKEGV